jgi:O-antigen biosynthesis protein
MAVSKYDIDLDLAQESNSSHWHVADLIGSMKRVLDVGCSTGYFAEALTERGNEVLGVEYDEASAQIARERGLEVLTADLETADLAAHFGAGSFDVVVYADVLEHLRDPLPVLRSTHDLLAPGGFVVISLPNIAHGDIRLALLDGKFDYTETGILDTTHTRFFTRSSLLRFVREAGFAVAEVRRTTAALFETEQGLDAASYDPTLVERVLADPESLTYQFVVKAVVDDGAASGLGLPERLYDAEIERDRLADETAQLRQRIEGAESETEAMREELARITTELMGEIEKLRGVLTRERETFARDRDELRRNRGRLREERDRLRAKLESRDRQD